MSCLRNMTPGQWHTAAAAIRNHHGALFRECATINEAAYNVSRPAGFISSNKWYSIITVKERMKLFAIMLVTDRSKCLRNCTNRRKLEFQCSLTRLIEISHTNICSHHIACKSYGFINFSSHKRHSFWRKKKKLWVLIVILDARI